MTLSLSPKKFVSNFNNKNNKGVEAKEVEIANMRLDTSARALALHPHSSCGSLQELPAPADRSGAESALRTRTDSHPSLATVATHTTSDTTSYIQLQVVVQKHHRTASAPAPAAKVPTASSPITRDDDLPKVRGAGGAGGAGDGARGVYVVPHPLLLTYPAHHHQYTYGSRAEAGCSARSSSSFRKVVRALRAGRKRAPPPPRKEPKVKEDKEHLWTCLGNVSTASQYDISPPRVKVYYLERACPAYLSAAQAGPATVVGRWAARGERAGRRLCAELCAVPRLALAVPVAAAVETQRAVLGAARAVAGGALTALADLLLKPALAVAHEAVVRPPLVCLSSVLWAVRDALRPLALLLHDLLEPLVGVLAALRLVHVHVGGARRRRRLLGRRV